MNSFQIPTCPLLSKLPAALISWRRLGTLAVLFATLIFVSACGEKPYKDHPIVGEWRAVEFFDQGPADDSWTETFHGSGRWQADHMLVETPQKHIGIFEVNGDILTVSSEIFGTVVYKFAVDGNTLTTTKDFDSPQYTPMTVKYERVSD